jgi:ribosomal-protein-alanine N-acetyltransferase
MTPLPVFNESGFGTFPVLETPRIVLRRILPADEPAVYAILSNPEVQRYSGRAPFQTSAEAKTWIETVENAWKGKEGIRWAMELKESNTYIGSLGFWKILRQHARAEIGYELNSDYWKRGLMQEAIDVILDYGFQNLKLHSVEANVTPENRASVALLKRAGFVQEGYFLQNFCGTDGFLDTASFSLLARNFRNTPR